MNRKGAKTYNSGDSLVVTHLTTSPPVEGLTCEEQTSFCGLLRLWSYVEEKCDGFLHIRIGKMVIGPSSVLSKLNAKILSSHITALLLACWKNPRANFLRHKTYAVGGASRTI